jgi:hypothetical protein
MKNSPQLTRIVLYQNLGFLSIVILCFLDELIQLPSLIFSDHPFAFLFRRSTLNFLFTLAIWFVVSSSTRRIMQHVHYLEKFLRVCAWCRRINYQGEWMRLEEFMQQGFDTPTTHGICTECLRQQQAAVEKAKAMRKNEASLPK